uniref:DUF6221 family protein n=1 Tax=Arthrobacter silvisoli TaxID=2291022 RepID=UPI003F493226
MNITEFLEARIAEDEAAARKDRRHWSEVPSPAFSADRVLRDVASKRELIKRLTYVADYAWAGSYAVRDMGSEMIQALAAVYADHPDYQKEWAIG